MKRIFVVFLLILILLVPTTVSALDLSEKIYDDAGLLDIDEAAKLQADAFSIINRHSLDVVVLTEERNISNASSRAIDFYDNNNFGVGEHGDGIMLYINMNTRDIYILTTGRAEPLFERRIDNMLDDIIPYLSDADYHTGVQTFLSLTNKIIEENGGLPDYIYPPDAVPVTMAEHIGFSFLVGLGVGLVITLIMVAVHKRSLPASPSYHTYLGENGVKVNREIDQFVSTHTTRTAIPKSSSSSSSGGGGRSHGGGGGKF